MLRRAKDTRPLGEDEHEPGELTADAETVVRRYSSRARARGAQDVAVRVTTGDDARPAPAAQDAIAELTPTTVDQQAEDKAIDEIVFAEEARRARAFSAVAMLMVAIVAVQMPLLGGDADAKRVALVAMTAMFGAAAWAFVRAKDPKSYSPAVFRAQGWVLATGMLGVQYYVGFYSAITVVLSLGIYYLGQSTDRQHAWLLPIYVTATWLGGAVLTTAGILPDSGLYPIANIPMSSQVVIAIGVPCALVASMAMAGMARSNVLEAIRNSQEALLEAQKRGALLAEAHNHLDRAMRFSVGRAGRHTDQLAGDFELGVVVGVGAMGEVYAATHRLDGRKAAVKLLHADAMRREDMLARFLREADISSRLDHPNLVRIYDVGRMEDGSPYLAMERLEGYPLSTILRERGQLSLAEVVALADAVGAGLSHAHARGIVHRDLKPANIIAVEVGGPLPRWTILDFGISRLVDSTGTLTHDILVGTPAYMSPEQALGQDVDGRSDLFAMSAVLYRALTGRPAFPGSDTPRIMFDVAYSMPEQPSRHAKGIAADVDLALALGLAKDRERRFQTASELMAALRAAVQGKLDGELRSQARALLVERPWGSRPVGAPTSR